MIKFDMWYDDPITSIDNASITFYPNDAQYRGNVLKPGKIIGDYVADDSVELVKRLNALIGEKEA